MSDNEAMDKFKRIIMQVITLLLISAWCVLAFSDPDPRTIWYDIFIWSTVSYLVISCLIIVTLIVRWLYKLYKKATEEQFD